jgi:hypothetical protein
MLIKLIFISLFYLSQSILTDSSELKRQYSNYLEIFDKVETSKGFENFVQNLGTIEYHNQNRHNGCKLYLTQYSDTTNDNSIYNSCEHQ